MNPDVFLIAVTSKGLQLSINRWSGEIIIKGKPALVEQWVSDTMRKYIHCHREELISLLQLCDGAEDYSTGINPVSCSDNFDSTDRSMRSLEPTEINFPEGQSCIIQSNSADEVKRFVDRAAVNLELPWPNHGCDDSVPSGFPKFLGASSLLIHRAFNREFKAVPLRLRFGRVVLDPNDFVLLTADNICQLETCDRISLWNNDCVTELYRDLCEVESLMAEKPE